MPFTCEDVLEKSLSGGGGVSPVFFVQADNETSKNVIITFVAIIIKN